jgi:hypothetical protein
MAVKSATVTRYGEGVLVVRWAGLANGDTGEPVVIPAAHDKSIHFSGTFGAGGSVSLRGSNKATPVVSGDPILTAGEGGANPITKTAEGIEQVQENPLHVWPHVTAGDGTTAINADLVVKGKGV